MSDAGRFICRFAVGRDRKAYSSVWRVWTARRKPDLYIAVQHLGGEFKASAHAPRPPHTGWERHLGFPKEAAGAVAEQAKRDGGPHKVRWTGNKLSDEVTLECRVIVRGTSLEEDGEDVDDSVALLPIPSKDESVEVTVLLGPQGPTQGYPRDSESPTFLLNEGRLSDGRRVWIVYVVRRSKPDEIAASSEPGQVVPKSSYVDPNADLSSGRMRAVAFGAQCDGSLTLFDFRATIIDNRS